MRVLVTWIFLAYLAISLPLAADTMRIGISKGETREIDVIKIGNGCISEVTWRIKVKGLPFAEAPRRIKIAPMAGDVLKIRIDSSKAKKSRFRGSVRLKCVDCRKKRCTGKETSETVPIVLSVIDLDRAEGMAEDFLKKAGLPFRLLGFSVDAHISSEGLKDAARKLLHSTYEFFLDERGEPVPVSEELVSELISGGFVRPGQFLARATWQRDTGQAVATLAAVTDSGNIAYEPNLFFNAFSDLRAPEPRRGSWKWAPWELTLINGLGSTCVEVEWGVAIEVDGCAVADPEPHVSVLRQNANCWTWSQETTTDENPWCLTNSRCSRPGCSTTSVDSGEGCIKWRVATEVTRGLAGSKSTYETVRNLCAVSGGLPDT